MTEEEETAGLSRAGKFICAITREVSQERFAEYSAKDIIEAGGSEEQMEGRRRQQGKSILELPFK